MKKMFRYLLVPTILMVAMCFSELKAQEWTQNPWFRTDKPAGGASAFITVTNSSRIKDLTIMPLNSGVYKSLLKERIWAVPVASASGYEMKSADAEISFPAQVIYFTYKKDKKPVASKPTEALHLAFMVTYNDGGQQISKIVSGQLLGAEQLLDKNAGDVGHSLKFELTDKALGLRPLPRVTLKTKINYPMFISLGDAKFLVEGGEAVNIEGTLKSVNAKVVEAPEPGNYDFDFEIKIPNYGWVQVWNQDGTRKKLRASVDSSGVILTVVPQDLSGILGSKDNTVFGSGRKKTIFLRTFVSPGLEFFWGATMDEVGSRVFSDKNERALIASERYTAFSLPAGNVSFMYRPAGTTNTNRFFIAELPVSRRQKGKFTIRQGVITSDTN